MKNHTKELPITDPGFRLVAEVALDGQRIQSERERRDAERAESLARQTTMFERMHRAVDGRAIV